MWRLWIDRSKICMIVIYWLEVSIGLNFRYEARPNSRSQFRIPIEAIRNVENRVGKMSKSQHTRKVESNGVAFLSFF